MHSRRSNKNDVFKHLQQRVAQIKDDKQAQEISVTAPLSRKEIYTLTLSKGSPADGFKMIVDPKSKAIEDVIYYYSDWFSYDEYKLTLEQVGPIESFFDYLIKG